MSGNVGKKIVDSYCNGHFDRRHDFYNAIIEAEGKDWIVIRTTDGTAQFAEFNSDSDKQEHINKWCTPIWAQLEA